MNNTKTDTAISQTTSAGQKFLWLAIVLVFPLTNMFWRTIPPNDYWWYLRLGAEIIQERAVPVLETYSYTQAGQPIIYHSWLSALFFYTLKTVGGSALTILVVALIIAMTYFLLWKLMRKSGLDIRWTALLLLLIEIASGQNWAVRPQLFSYPLFVLSLSLLWDWEKGKHKFLWTLPFITLLWVNLHGSFPLAFLLVGAAFVFGRGNRKKLFVIIVFMLIALLMNPRGIGVGNYIVKSLTSTSNQNFSVEWLPPVNSGLQANLFFASFLGLMILASLSTYKPSLMVWSWLLGFAWLALSGSRYDIWYLFILAPITAFLLAPLLAKKKTIRRAKEHPKINFGLGILLFLFPLLFFPTIRGSRIKNVPETLSKDTPVAAAEWLAAHPEVRDPIWADLAFESYLVYALPKRPVWIDTRFEAYPPEHWENYKKVSRAAWNWQAILDAAGINTLMLSKENQPDLLVAVQSSPFWCPVYEDEQAVIYERNTKQGVCP